MYDTEENLNKKIRLSFGGNEKTDEIRQRFSLTCRYALRSLFSPSLFSLRSLSLSLSLWYHSAVSNSLSLARSLSFSLTVCESTPSVRFKFLVAPEIKKVGSCFDSLKWCATSKNEWILWLCSMIMLAYYTTLSPTARRFYFVRITLTCAKID